MLEVYSQEFGTGTFNVAIVTGASSGIGLEVTKRLAAKGYRVVANSRNIKSAMTLQATGDLKLVDGDIGLSETAQRVVAIAVPQDSAGRARRAWREFSRR